MWQIPYKMEGEHAHMQEISCKMEGEHAQMWPNTMQNDKFKVQTVANTRQIVPAKKSKNKMKPTNPNAHTYVNGTDVKTHGYAVTHNTFLQ